MDCNKHIRGLRNKWMQVFSKSGKTWGHDFVFKANKTLDHVDFSQPNITFYHHPYDSLMENIPLHDSLNGACWNHLKNNVDSVLIHDNDAETFDHTFVKDVIKTVKMHEFKTKQLRIFVMDENHKQYLETMVAREGITGLDVRVKNYLLNEVKLPAITKEPIKRFSSLSRNYRDWRLRLYVELLRKGILEKDFIYSFFNIWPYNDPPKVYKPAVMIEDLNNLGFTDVDKNIKKWLKACPHELDSNNVLNKWSNITYDAIQSSNIHIIIETHFDQKAFAQDKEYDRDFAPSSITEKAYKPIACKRPFIAYSTPYWLQDLRNLGFKTFAPFINEDYDKVTNNEIRMKMIVSEIERLANLPQDKFDEVVKGCQEIAEYNYNKLVEKQNG